MEVVLLAIFRFFESLGLTGAFLSMFIENIGIPLPTEIGYLLGQAAINNGASFVYVLLILTAGHFSGALVAYGFGIWGDSYVSTKLKPGHKLFEVHAKLTRWFNKYGNLTVFLTRFVGYVRPWSSFIAGFSRVALLPFMLWTLLGSLIFNVIALYFSKLFIVVWQRFTGYHILLAGLFFITFFGLLLFELARGVVIKRS